MFYTLVQLKVGDVTHFIAVYIVLGGTVDITAHEILLDGSVKEISPPCGGPWGAISVDKRFVLQLEHIFGREFIDTFKADKPQEWLTFISNFEKKKRAFKPDGKCSIRIPIPYSFDNDILKNVSANAKREGVGFASGHLTVKHEVALGFFSESIDHIFDQVISLLTEERLASLNYILLVGGFASCPILQDACRSIIPEKIKVLIPIDAQLAVMRGAVLFGHNPLQICSRIARCTYGIAINDKFCEGVHTPSKKFVDYQDDEMCSDIFEVLVTKGERVENRGTKTTVLLRSSEKDSIGIRIFKTEKTDVTYVDEPEVTKIGEAVLSNFTGDNLEVKLTFGFTEMLIEARDTSEKDDFPVKITIDFLS